MQQAPEDMPPDLVTSRLKVYNAEVQRLASMPVLVNDMLKGKGRVGGAKLWPIALSECWTASAAALCT